jgi:hypothetical protein
MAARPRARKCLRCHHGAGVFAYVLHDADGVAWSVLAHPACMPKLQARSPLRFIPDWAAEGVGRHVAIGIRKPVRKAVL